MKNRVLSVFFALCLVLLLPLGNRASASGSDFLLAGSSSIDKYTGPGGAVVIPDGVTNISYEAFAGCTGLTSITIPDSVTYIGTRAFAGCTNLTEINFLGRVDYISYDAFDNTPWLEHMGDFPIVNGLLIAYQGSASKVTVPNSVTKINTNAFSYNNLRSVVIPDSVTTVGGSAFSGCTNLADVALSKNITKIYSSSFQNTPWLEAQYNGDFAISNGILLGYRGLDSTVVIPDGVTVISNDLFRYCDNHSILTDIFIPDSVTNIGDHAFAECGNLTSVKMGSNITKLGDFAFYNCDNLISIDIPAGVTMIGNNVFSNCTKLSHITISDNVTSIGYGAFLNCTGLTDFKFPSNLQYIEPLAFSATSLQNMPHEIKTALYRNARDEWLNPGQCLEAQNERITALSRKITNGINSDYEKVKAVTTWVSENIAYGDTGIAVPTMDDILDSRTAVCSGYSQLTSALLQAQGIPAINVSGSSGGNHEWNEIFVDGRWILADTTWGPYYFDMNLEDFTDAHIVWDRPSAAPGNMPSNWAREGVWETISSGLAPYDLQSGYRSNITREEFCRLMTVLIEKHTNTDIAAYLAAEKLTPTADFRDTDSAAVCAAYTLGIVNGVSETVFNPNGFITRQEAAVMLARTAKLLGLTADAGEHFADAGNFASWAAESIAFVSGLTDPNSGVRVMGGVGTGTFSPAENYTREQALITTLRLFHCSSKY